MIAGGCRCGESRYTIALESLPKVYCCHCLDCQSWTGSAFSEQAVVAEDRLTVTGPVVTYSYETPSGATSTHRACATCHSRLFNANSRLPGWFIVRAGTMDNSNAIEPAMHIWTSSKQPWVTIPDASVEFAKNAPPERFKAALQGE